MTSKFLGSLGITALFFFFLAIAGRDAVLQTKSKEADQDKTIKVKTELIEVHAVVTDRQGRVVDNLTKEDFELLENKKSQEISFFSMSRLEDESGRPGPGSRTQPKTLRQRLTEPPARTTVLFVDNLHMKFDNLNWVKQQLHRFVNEKMTAQDSVALVTTSSVSGIAQQFTRDRQALHYAIDQVSMGPIAIDRGMTAYLAARITLGDPVALEVGKEILKAEGIDDKYGSMTRARALLILDEVSFLRESTLVTLKAVIEQMIGMPGQRMIAIFSEGFTQHGRDGWPKYDEVQSAINRAARSGVVVYAIDAKLLQRGGGGDINGYAAASEYEMLDALSALAKNTGGELFMNTNNLEGALGEAMDANRCYYVLAYYLTRGEDLLQFRSITARVRNHPEYTVRTPKGFSLSDTKSVLEDNVGNTQNKSLIRAVNSILPKTNLNVSARMDFMESRSDTPQVTLTVCFDGDKLQYRKQDQHQVFNVEIVYEIFDSSGKQVDSLATKVEGTLAQERVDKGRSNGYLFSKLLTLKPGIYQARVGVREMESDLMGTTSAWIEVPDIARTRLALSSLMLLDILPGNDAVAEQTGADELKPVRMLQGIRLYPRDNTCGYLFRVYRSVKTPIGSNLTLKTELLEGGKPIRQSRWMSIAADEKAMDRDGQVFVGGKLNLAGLKPGVYELSVSVKDPGLNKIAQRSAVFGVE
ncbi:MAG TPA: VWA domain-containing protein [Acidobacteriota bacterium]|nr:VWA domain-containing protein [Acidobacteriota bacterium]